MSVKTIDYTILARLTKPRLRMMISDYPEWGLELKKYIFRYRDNYKDLMTSVFNRIEYFKNLKPDTFHQLIYLFERVKFDENEIVLRQYDVIDSLIIVLGGQLEVVMNVDGFEMVVARLTRANCLNYRNICVENRKMFLSVRASKPSVLLILPISSLLSFLAVEKELRRKINRYAMNLERTNTQFLLDILPSSTAESRKIKLQNTVMQILIEQRAERNKPSLSSLFLMFRNLGFDESLINDELKAKFVKKQSQIQDE